MWPWGHLAVGYLLYSLSFRLRTGTKPEALPVVLLTIGTQLPDLIDKPLAYWFDVLPEGRALAHSFLFIVPLCILFMLYMRNIGRTEAGFALSIGISSHPIADGLHSLVRGEWGQLTYMVWPALPAPDYEASSFAYHLQQLITSIRELSFGTITTPAEGLFLIELWLSLFLLLLWIVDGMPPVRATITLLRRTPPTSR